VQLRPLYAKMRYLNRWSATACVLCALALVATGGGLRARPQGTSGVKLPSEPSTLSLALTTTAGGLAQNVAVSAPDSDPVPASPRAVRVGAVASIAADATGTPTPNTEMPKPVLPDSLWRHPGMCAAETSRDAQEARIRYLASFVPIIAWHTTVYAAPDVPSHAVESVRSYLEPLHQLVNSQLGLESEPPPIYLYPTAEAVRAHSCTSKTAVAYYDGAIHVAAEIAELRSSLRHEYAHHVLVSNGIGGPMWFQEGTAMAVGHDCPLQAWQLWRDHPISLDQMVIGLPRPSTLEATTIFNAQACVMQEFLERLCSTLEGCGTRELANALISGRASPKTLFSWAITQRGGDLIRTTGLPLWDDYAQRGDFAPATKAALLRRAGVGPPP
jgi:hypothetical protein